MDASAQKDAYRDLKNDYDEKVRIVKAFTKIAGRLSDY
jgi:hypothetical protein